MTQAQLYNLARSTHPCTDPVELDGVRFRCKTRFVDRCPGCAELYRLDWGAIARSGVFDPDPAVKGKLADGFAFYFLTLTAPSFGKIIPGTGVPRNPGSYDYLGQVRWNAAVPRIWKSTLKRLQRAMGFGPGTRNEMNGQLEQAPEEHLGYFKVAEWQARGALHLHIVVRIPVAHLPSAGAAKILHEVQQACARCPATGDRLRWGAQADVQELGKTNFRRVEADESEARTAARTLGYVLKAIGYTSKNLGADAEHSPALEAHRTRLREVARKDWICDRCITNTNPDTGEEERLACYDRRHYSMGATQKPVSASYGWSLTGLNRTEQHEARKAWAAAHGGSAVDRDPDAMARWMRSVPGHTVELADQLRNSPAKARAP